MGRSLRRAGLRPGGLGADQGIDGCDQFLGMYRFHDVTVHPLAETWRNFVWSESGDSHDLDRRVPVSQALKRLQPINLWHRVIEQYNLNLPRGGIEKGQSHRTRRCSEYREAVMLQHSADKLPEHKVVVNDQDQIFFSTNGFALGFGRRFGARRIPQIGIRWNK